MPRVPFDPATDYYELLGVRPEASAEDIQAAYRRLAKAYHPDLHADSSAAATHMARLNIAKSVLLDPYTRASYDQLRTGRRSVSYVVATPPPAPVTVRYAPHQAATRPRHRVVSHAASRSAPRSTFDRQTGVLLIIAVPLLAALLLYVFEAIQLSVQPLKAAPADLALSPNGRPTAHGTADAAFIMVHAQPPSTELAMRTNNLILARADSSPESELLRAVGRRLMRSANSGDWATWDDTVAELCHLALRC